MTKPTDNPNPSRTLRERAEEMLKAPQADIDEMSMEDVRRLLHELRVHQMELEIQNEDLRESHVDLAQSRDRYSDLYEFAPVGYLTLDRHGVIRQANLTAASMLGVDRQNLLRVSLASFVSEASQDDLHRHRRSVIAGGDSQSGVTKQTCEIEMQRSDGSPLVIRLESLSCRNEDGELSECRTALIDITILKQARRELIESEQRYQRLAEAVIDYIFTVRLKYGEAVETVHGLNCETITGYTPDEFAANEQLWASMIPPEDRPLVDHHIRQTLAGQNVAPLEHRLRRKDGTLRWVLRVVSPQLDEYGSVIAYDGLLRDITGRKQAEDALRQLNEELEHRVDMRTAELRARTDQLAAHSRELEQREQEVRLQAEAIANLGEGVLITGDHLEWPGPEIIFVNEAMCRITGYTADELIGQSPRMLQGNGTDRQTRERIKTELSAGHSCHAELVNYRKDGTAYEAEVLITPLFDAQGHHTNFVSIHRDVTERNRARQTLHDQQERTKAILNTAADAIITIDRRGIIDGVNAATERMFGYTSEELTGRNVSLLMPPPFTDEHDSYIARYLETGQARVIGIGREVIGRHKDGTLFPAELAVSAVDHLGIFTGIVRDISLRKRLEREVLDIAAGEQRRIGQDLHDDLGQRLGGLGMLADALAKSLARQVQPPVEQNMARQIQQGLKQATALVRTLAYGLVPVDVTSDSLADALRNLVIRMHDSDGIQCSFDCPTEVELQDHETATQLFRIAQEAAINAVRHGSPTLIGISLEPGDSVVVLRIHDDGAGFDSDAAEHAQAGVGLRSMRYRASQIGARLEIESTSNDGTTVTCTVPLRPPGASSSQTTP